MSALIPERLARTTGPTLSATILEGFYKEAQRYFVYRNINKSKDQHVYSLKNKKTGRVERHVSDEQYLSDPVFKVSDKGRKRVLREGRKNVHAGVEGSLGLAGDPEDLSWREVTYDPRKYKSFIFRDTGKPIRTGDATAVRLTPGGVQVGSSFWKGFEDGKERRAS